MKPRLLANENFPAPSVAHLRALGYDVRAVAEEARGLADEAVLALAATESRWLLTFDRDYGELVFLRGLPVPPSVVLLRLRSYRPEYPGQFLADLLTTETTWQGNFVVVEQTELRKRRLPTAAKE